jgi:hypothetical protein
MSSIYKLTAPQIGNPNTANTSSHLVGDAETNSISSINGGNVQFNNNINVTRMYGTASFADNLVPKNVPYNITASLANSAITAGTSNTASFLNYQAGNPNNGTASYAMSAGSVAGFKSIVNTYQILYSGSQSGNLNTGTSVATPISISLVPTSVNSKFIISSNVALYNGTSAGIAVPGLYRDSTPLISKFSSWSGEQLNEEAMANNVFWIDAPNTTASIIYGIKMNTSYGYFRLNQGNSITVTSSMCIMEIV